jgi:hypothetical protein
MDLPNAEEFSVVEVHGDHDKDEREKVILNDSLERLWSDLSQSKGKDISDATQQTRHPSLLLSARRKAVAHWLFRTLWLADDAAWLPQ